MNREYRPGDKFVIEIGEEIAPGKYQIKGTFKALYTHNLDKLPRVEQTDLSVIGLKDCDGIYRKVN